MGTSYDVVVVGGGVIGLTTAYYLAGDGLRVAVLDKGELGRESSWAGAGIVSPGNPRRAASPLGRLKALSTQLFPVLSAELREATGIDNGYLRCGGLEVRRSADALEKERVANVLREERGEGVACEVLDGDQLRALEPVLSPALPGAVFFPEVAQVRNPRHLRALMLGCSARGVTLMTNATVRGFVREGEHCRGVLTEKETLPAAHVLLAAGAWSGGLAEALGLQLPIRPIRGQIVLLHTGQPRLRRIVQAGTEYLVPRDDGRVLVGSTEEDVGFVRQTTAVGVEGLLRFVRQVAPGLAEAPVEACWAGLRPGSADGRPFLGRAPGWTNAFVAAGHFRSGITLSPATGRILADVILGRQPPVAIEAFRLDRPLPGNGGQARANQE